MFSIEYEIEDAGWAYANVSNEERSIDIRVSYLHDTLRELAEAALLLVSEETSAKVVFMDEPGEHQVIFNKEQNGEIHFLVLWFDDWESWGMYPTEKQKLLMEGRCSVSRIKHQVTNILWRIYEKIGEDKYLELWGEHPFPTGLYKELQNA